MAGTDNTTHDFLAGFINDYFAECDEHLATIRRLLAEASPSAGLTARTLEELFRAFHSIKGLSAMVEVRDAELLSHHMEGYLRLLRDRETSLSAAGLDALIIGTSRLEQVIAARRDGGAAPPIGDALAALEALSSSNRAQANAVIEDGGAASVAAGTRRWLVEFTPSRELAARGVTVDLVRERLASTGRIADAAPKVGDGGAIRFEFLLEEVHEGTDFSSWTADGINATPAPATPPVEEAPAPLAAVSPSLFLRVDHGRLDELMRMFGDGVITRASRDE